MRKLNAWSTFCFGVRKLHTTWTVGHRESALWLASGSQQHHAKGANSGKGQDTITALSRGERGTPALPLGVQVSQRASTCRLRAPKAITRASSCSPLRFIINYCLANEGRVRFKNTGDLKEGGVSRTMVGSQPLTMTINILLAAGLTATTTPAPLLVIELQTFSPRNSAQPTRYG